MIVDRTILIEAPAVETYRRVLDIPFVGSCLPGASDIRSDGDDVYRGVFAVKVGPVRVQLEGSVSIAEADHAERRAVLRLNGSDRRIGGNVVGDMDIRVEDNGEQSKLVVHTEMVISGKLGQFGQAVMIKKADQITSAFVEEFSRRLSEDLTLDAKMGLGGQLVPAAAPSAPTAPEVTAAPSGRDPVRSVAALHGVIALLRRGRRLLVVSSAASLRKRAGDSAQVWLTPQALQHGVTVELLQGREHVVVLQESLPARVNVAWEALAGAGLGAAAAVAVKPVGEALADPVVLHALCEAVGDVSGKPVLTVASTPWSVLPLARLARTGACQGVVADCSPEEGVDVAPMMRLAIAEVRRAGIDCPIIAGPVGGRAEEEMLRSAGADAVLVAPGGRRLRRRG